MSSWLKGDEAALWRAAARVLDANWTGRGTVPSPGLYPHLWSWDSAFISMGLVRHDRSRAERELLAVFRGQWARGLVPHIVFHPELPRFGYFPGPDLWRSRSVPGTPRDLDTSGLTGPPLQALAALRLHQCADAGDAERSRAFLARLYPLLTAQHRHLAEERDIGGAGLAAICHPWESGMDDSPSWDRPLSALDLPPSRYAPLRPPGAGVTAGEDHDRYVRLVTLLRDARYEAGHLRDEHPFLAEDPLFNAAYLASTHALAEIARIIGRDPAPHLEDAARIRRALLDRLWDGECFRVLDLRSGELIPTITVASFGPLLDPELPSPALRALVELLLSARFSGAAGYPVPSCDLQSASFDPTRYWRGPTWVNTNWLLWLAASVHGLTIISDLLHGTTLRLVRQSGFREYFDPFDGSGYGSHDYSWSAALVLDLLAARRASHAA